MDAVTAIATALSVGAGAAFKKFAGEVGGDLYQSVKGFFEGKLSEAEVKTLEENPTSEQGRALLSNKLEEIDPLSVKNLVEKAQEILKITKSDPQIARSGGFRMRDVEAASITLANVAANEFDWNRVTVKGHIKMQGVQFVERPSSKKARRKLGRRPSI